MQKRFDGNMLVKRPANAAEILVYEKVLAEGLREFLQELALADGGIILSCACAGKHANLGDIIGSSTEFTVREGSLSYANDAEVDFDWGTAPKVSLGIELRDERLTAFFRVVFGGDFVGVDIRGIHFAELDGDSRVNLRRFSETVAGVRLPPRPAVRRAAV
ncbi:hypothetical protein [Enterovirga sp.]|uniref:hypothetical protein n=1 Tax=Enterovirga sp. TaxID=2026350 RepID=UPI002C01F7BD|nr:hypothetical protein [Enterovirga sp.]HMO30757.1 hypothetical protein [Enterovirga sp.]